MTRLALVNAIYFKGNWMNRFDEANTKEMPFKLNQVRLADVETCIFELQTKFRLSKVIRPLLFYFLCTTE